MIPINHIEAWDFLQKNKDSILIDVRSIDEWKNGLVNIDDADNRLLLITITPNSDDFVDKLQQNVKNTSAPLLFLCYGGIRSAAAATMAEKAGYVNCYNISGGFCEWSKAGLPIK